MRLKCNHAKDHSTDNHDDVPKVGILHMSHMQQSHVLAAIHSCIITTARREPLTLMMISGTSGNAGFMLGSSFKHRYESWNYIETQLVYLQIAVTTLC